MASGLMKPERATPSSRAGMGRAARRRASRSRATARTARSESIGSGTVLLACRVVKSASRSRTVTVRARSPDSRRSLVARSTSSRSFCARAASSLRSWGKVSSRLMDLGSPNGSTAPSSRPRTRRWSHSPSRAPSQPASVFSSWRSASATERRPSLASRSWNFGPMPGISASEKRRMNSPSRPGSTMCTPSPFSLAPDP